MTKWLATASLLLAIQPAHGETLREAIAAAYETNPELAAARARQEALAEAPQQARAEGRLVAEANGDLGYLAASTCRNPKVP